MTFAGETNSADRKRATCADCDHFCSKEFDSDGVTPRFGQCRANPPAAVMQFGSPTSFWPPVSAEAWCGRIRVRSPQARLDGL